jgi:hypothetical protein
MLKLFLRDHACKYENVKIDRKIAVEILNETISTGMIISSGGPPSNLNRSV